MKNPNFLLLYVKNPAASAAFYSEILGRPAIEQSDGFAMLKLTDEMMLGLWRSADVEPAAHLTGGGAEIGFPVDSDEAVDALHARWTGQSLKIAQPPTRMEFGYTFVALDPDNHRLRVSCMKRR